MKKINKHSVGFKTSAVLLSRITSAFLSLIFVPLYIKLLGVESYGLVAFYLLLAGVLVIIDFALSTALSRQVVILKARQAPENSIKDLVFSIEIIYAGIAVLIFLTIYLFAENIAIHWIKSDEISIDRLKTTIRFIGILIALQLPTSIYNGVMISLDKQVLNASVTILFNVLKSAGVILILYFISPIIENYFIWQILITLIFIIILRFLVWKLISTTKVKPHFSKIQLYPIRIFAIGMIGVTIVNFLLSMVDKLVVSKLVTLNLVACYSLAFQISSVMSQLVSPLQSTIFPKFTALLTQRSIGEYTNLYHKSCKWVAIIIWPIGLILFLFAKDILLVWTNNTFVTTNAAPVLQVVTVGTIFNCLMFVPYVFMLSLGKTRFIIIQNIAGAIIFLPMLFWTIPKYGILGASFIWLAINISYFLIGIPLFHKLYMKNELFNWYIKDNLLPFLTSLTLIGTAKVARLNIGIFDSNIYFVTLMAFVAAIYIYLTPELQKIFLHLLKQKGIQK